MFYRMYRYAEFDASEMSLGTYCTARGQGDERFIALPIFLSRVFRHGYLYVRDGSDITHPSQLKGKRIGVSEYEATAAIWVRGFLQDDFGVNPWDVEWVVGRPEKLHGIPYNPSIRVTYESAESQDTALQLDETLARGEIDAYAATSISRLLGKGVRRMFPNYQEVEQDYFTRTGIFPIMHTFVMKRTMYEEYPWLARSLYKAFYRAKQAAEKWTYSTNGVPTSMPWLIPMIEKTREIMGPDPWPYGVRQSEKTLLAFGNYLQEQGLTKTRLDIDQLFLPVQWTNASQEKVSW
jgi:4,5-dihydroxyphthalate decarboxylase